MKKQIPHGPDDLICPLHRKAMSRVCHTCAWWTQIRGRDPQTDEPVDHWNCSMAVMPMLMVETSKNVRGVQAATESGRNETTKLLAEGILRAERRHKERAEYEDRIASTYRPPMALEDRSDD